MLKQVRGGDLVDAVRRVAAGESLLDPAVTGRVLNRLLHRTEAAVYAARLAERRQHRPRL